MTCVASERDGDRIKGAFVYPEFRWNCRGFLDSSAAGTLAISGVTLDEFSAPEIDEILIAGGTVTLDDTRLSTVSDIDDAGDISILGGDISLVGGTRLDASTRGTGDAGDIVIDGTNSVIAQGNERDSEGELVLRIVSASGAPPVWRRLPTSAPPVM